MPTWLGKAGIKRAGAEAAPGDVPAGAATMHCGCGQQFYVPPDCSGVVACPRCGEHMPTPGFQADSPEAACDAPTDPAASATEQSAAAQPSPAPA